MPSQEEASASSASGKASCGEAYIHFDCRFTEKIRMLFKRKRMELGLPYVKLGEIFGVNWSTVRKWEVGPTCNCELYYRPLVEKFLNGEYDCHFRCSNLLEMYASNIPPQMHQCMERVINTYLLCKGKPEIVDAFISSLDGLSKDALESMTEH